PPEAVAQLELDAFDQIVDVSLFGCDPGDQRAFWNLVRLAQALGKQSVSGDVQVSIVADHLHAVTPQDRLSPYKALALGQSPVIPREYPNDSCRPSDIPANEDPGALASLLIDEFSTEPAAAAVAYRDGVRWTQSFEPAPLPDPPEDT